MNNKIKAILMAVAVSSMVLTQGVSAAQFDDGEQVFSDGTDSSEATGSVSALASALAKQTEEETQKFVAKKEEAAQIREERRIEKAENASEKAEQEKAAALESIRQTVEDAKKKAAEEAEAKRVAKRQAVVDFALQFEGNPYVYGGTSLTNGADCSGFTQSVMSHFGIKIPRTADQQAIGYDGTTTKYATAKIISVNNIQPGDLVFYYQPISHVGLYIGNGLIVHASTEAAYPVGGIKTSPFDFATIRAIVRYW